MTKTKKDYDKDWIIEKSVEILKTYSDPITVRALYYLLGQLEACLHECETDVNACPKWFEEKTEVKS